MGEKVLVKSNRYSIGKALLIFALVVVVICVALYLFEYIALWKDFDSGYRFCTCSGSKKCYVHTICSSPGDYAWTFSDAEKYTYFGTAFGVCLICAFIYAWMRSYEITITDKRVYGKAAFGKRVDLPVDSISAIGSKWLNGVSVATSSGKISFLLVKNRDEIHECVSNLLLERQSKIAPSATVKQEFPQSNADELKKYKDLLDSGVITQEEFDAKKKQLLGL